MNKRDAGTRREILASEYLTSQGMRIVEHNFRSRQGEIDSIGYHDGYLVFVEVRYRSTERQGSAASTVDIRKQRRICRVADYYRYVHRIGEEYPVRYDVVAVQGTELQWIQNAFMHIYARG